MRLCSGEPDGLSPKCCEAALLAWFQEGRAAFVLGDLQGKRTWRYRAWWFRARVVARIGLLHVEGAQDPLSADWYTPACGAANGLLRSPR